LSFDRAHVSVAGLKRPHRIFWNCLDVVESLCLVLCENGLVDLNAWAAVRAAEDDIRRGIFALAAAPPRAEPDRTDDTNDPDRALSATVIGACLPAPRRGLSLSLSTCWPF
jgi:hypothetical protein